MILTDYYLFEKVTKKAKSRLDCTASTNSYNELEEKRATKQTQETDKRDATNVGDLLIYYNDVPFAFGGNARRKADKSITIKGKNLSSVYVPNIESGLGYGDMKGTADALLFVFHEMNIINGEIQDGAKIEMYVARGKSKDRVALYNMLADGGLEEEMEVLRKAVVKK